jgi:hypothetical protein
MLAAGIRFLREKGYEDSCTSPDLVCSCPHLDFLAPYLDLGLGCRSSHHRERDRHVENLCRSCGRYSFLAHRLYRRPSFACRGQSCRHIPVLRISCMLTLG